MADQALEKYQEPVPYSTGVCVRACAFASVSGSTFGYGLVGITRIFILVLSVFVCGLYRRRRVRRPPSGRSAGNGHRGTVYRLPFFGHGVTCGCAMGPANPCPVWGAHGWGSWWGGGKHGLLVGSDGWGSSASHHAGIWSSGLGGSARHPTSTGYGGAVGSSDLSPTSRWLGQAGHACGPSGPAGVGTSYYGAVRL